MPGKTDYRSAGVDIDAGDAFVDMIRKNNPAIGGFGGIVELPRGMRQPRLVVSTDGVGTKLLVADAAKDWSTVGIDLVAMVVNDIVVCGAKPIAFLDYYAVDRLRLERAGEILRGIEEGCRMAGCPLSGGETAELPGVYPKDGYDLAGFGVGVVEKKEIIDGSTVRPGDVLIGMPSSGLHSNGYSLARKVLLSADRPNRNLVREMLTPTIIYVKPVLALIRKVKVKALAHITGGGIPGNLERVLPEGCRAVVDSTTWEPAPIFAKVRETGHIAPDEMFRVFNMGIGMIAVVSKKSVPETLKVLRRRMVPAIPIGQVVEGERGVEVVGG